ncbi:MAG: hypothetical protein WBH31_12205 [Promethearchaeia archaeon]
MKRKTFNFIGLIIVSFLLISSLSLISINNEISQDFNLIYGDFDLRLSNQNSENVTVISDGFNGVWGWNDGWSATPLVKVHHFHGS